MSQTLRMLQLFAVQTPPKAQFRYKTYLHFSLDDCHHWTLLRKDLS